MRHMKKYQIYIFIISILTSIFIFENVIFDRTSEAYTESYYYSVQSNLLEVETLAIEMYKNTSLIIYNGIVGESIAEIINQANDSNDEKKDLLRKELFSTLNNWYLNMDLNNFRQFHFHLLNGDSFLRFHRPDKYGDNLLEVRESVKRVLETGEFIEGFEEGKIFNGYRFVYPVKYQEELVGSVELSISYKTVSELIRKFSDYDVLFLINKEVVESKLFEDEISNYIKNESFPDYYLESYVHFNQLNQTIGISEDEFNKINLQINGMIHENTYNKWTFNIHEFKEYTIFTFINPVYNLKNELVGYSVYYGSEPLFHLNSKIENGHNIVFYLLNTLILFAIAFIVYLYIQAREKSYRDKLTSLFNRTYFNKKVVETIKKSKVSSIIMMDIDDFKKNNDVFGHNEGDIVLTIVSEIIQKCIRISDLPFRWGGEEFAVILPETNIENAVNIAERIRITITLEKHTFEKYNITASFGVAEYISKEDIIEFFRRVDENLYEAKAQGKNRTIYKI
ncbi:MAG: diguanylate cyclase [Clostridiales bacterium]|nr:diguanylate cyclase [Clostridiales bacterium]